MSEQTTNTEERTITDLVVKIDGQVAESNLSTFKQDVLFWMEDINKSIGSPETEQQYAELDAAVKTLKELETKIAAAKKAALESTADINVLMREFDTIEELIRTDRLKHEKTVADGKEKIKKNIISAGEKQILESVSKLTHGKTIPVDVTVVAAAAKGKKKQDTMQKAVDVAVKTEVERCQKLDAHYSANLELIAETEQESPGLFHDKQILMKKPTEELTAEIGRRVAEFKLAQQEKASKAVSEVKPEPEKQVNNETEKQPEKTPEKEDQKPAQAIIFSSRPASFGGIPVQEAPGTQKEPESELWEILVTVKCGKEQAIELARDVDAYTADYEEREGKVRLRKAQ